MPANLENSAVATGLEKVSFYSNPQERQCQRILKLPHNCTHLMVAHMVKRLPAMQETRVQSLSWEDPWRRERLTTPVFCPGEFHGQRSLAGYSPWGVIHHRGTLSSHHYSSFYTFCFVDPPPCLLNKLLDLNILLSFTWCQSFHFQEMLIINFSGNVYIDYNFKAWNTLPGNWQSNTILSDLLNMLLV